MAKMQANKRAGSQALRMTERLIVVDRYEGDLKLLERRKGVEAILMIAPWDLVVSGGMKGWSRTVPLCVTSTTGMALFRPKAKCLQIKGF